MNIQVWSCMRYASSDRWWRIVSHNHNLDVDHNAGSSNVNPRRARPRGVFVVGVLTEEKASGVFHGFCAGLGVILMKSAKSKCCPGVVGNRLPPPGVVIIDDGNAISLRGGGVEGGSIRVILAVDMAGEGEVARYMSKSAPSSPTFSFGAPLPSLPRRRFTLRLRMGGVRGGDDGSTWKEWIGSRSSSSSAGAAKLGDVRSTEGRRVPWKKETSGPFEVVKCCLRALMGDDWISWCCFLQEWWV